MHKKVISNISKISALAAISMVAMTGCSIIGGQEAPELSEEVIKEQLKQTLNENEYAIDEITELTYTQAAFTEEEKASLSSQFTSKASVKKYRCNFSSTSIERGITGTYDLVFAYMNKEWKFITSSPYDEANWLYSAKDVVSAKQIRDDLQTIDIPELNGSKVGQESDTKIEVGERQSNIENGNDSMKVAITYDAKFAVYKFNIRLQYQFKNGKWEMTSSAVDEQSFWNIEFDESMKPNEPKESFIINELSNSSNYKNYMMNLSYVDNYYLTKSDETVNGNELSYNYVLIVSYDVFGDIEYNVNKKYIWTNNAWQEGDLSISIKSADWSKMIGTWASTNGDFLRVNDVDKEKLIGTYTHKYADGDYVTYAVTGKIDIELKDNDWDLMIEQGEITAGSEEEHFVILPFKVNLKDDTITSNGNIYVAKGNEDGGSGLHIDDNTYYEEGNNDIPAIEHEDDYSSGISFFDEDDDKTEGENSNGAENNDENERSGEDESEDTSDKEGKEDE